jgi:hypothetical protein
MVPVAAVVAEMGFDLLMMRSVRIHRSGMHLDTGERWNYILTDCIPPFEVMDIPAGNRSAISFLNRINGTWALTA